MALVGEWLKRPVVLGIACWALGAGMAMLLLGVPALWTSTAAGWAAAVGTMAAAGVALHLGRVGMASARRVEATSTTALAVMALPFIEDYHHRIYAIEEMTAAVGPPNDRLFYEGTLTASVGVRRDLSTEGQKLSASGIGSLLHNWSGAEPYLVREVAEVAAVINRVAALMRKPFQAAPGEGTYGQGPQLLGQLYEALGDAGMRLARLRVRCEDIVNRAVE